MQVPGVPVGVRAPDGVRGAAPVAGGHRSFMADPTMAYLRRDRVWHFGAKVMRKMASVHYPDTQHSVALACSAAVCQHTEQQGQKDVKRGSKGGQKEAKNGHNRVNLSQPREPTLS